MVILYYRIWKAAKRFQIKDRTIKTGILSVFGEKISFKDRKTSIEKYEDKALKTLGIIMSVFIICWLPFFILALLKSQILINGIPKWVDALTLWLGYFNSMLNPLIYCKFNRDFRLPFREMLCCRFYTIQNVVRRESYKSQFGDI
uniref:G-protein coupled receptors family 1 profile domain-containing protein n=1 Tax=Panagrolaimus sp. PS1159 TaxID=55785 RepID=A0AC35F857_9BILA